LAVCGAVAIIDGMTTETIEVDAATAAALRARAAARGPSVSDLEATVAHEDVARWLETWGTPAFKPWHDR
jgi:hypothetical protein